MPRRASRSEERDPVPSHVLPIELERSLREHLGDEVPSLVQALQQPSPTSLRLNPAKPSAVNGEPIPWCSTGRYLAERPAFTFDPLLHAGAYYVQEASSMLLEQALLATGLLHRDLLALDLCAAPGGKTTHLRSMLSPGSLLVANEVDGARRNALAENLWKWGADNVIITGSDPGDLERLPEHFDLILVDAPCSGEGMFRKDPFARQQWSPALVDRCATTQTRILERAWEALSPGGILIYSTCTWEAAENEDQLRKLVERSSEPVELPLDPAWGVACTGTGMMPAYRCYPHRVRGEGFFLGLMRKPGILRERTTQQNDARAEHIALPPGQARDRSGRAGLEWLGSPADHVLLEQGGILHALGTQWMSAHDALSTSLRVTAPGTPFAEKKGNDWRPHPASAPALALDRSAFPELELDEASAVAYLQGHALPAKEARGTALVTYQGHPLGWVQGAGSRWNNRYPPAWRIRAQQPAAPRVSWPVPPANRR